MSAWQKMVGWLRDHERSISAGVALGSLAIALLASAASVLQAALLMSQVWTPYRTALYVRQLEVAADYHAAAHEQWAAIIDLDQQCRVMLSAGGGGPKDLWDLSERFREGSTDLHEAYSATISTFPSVLHTRARDVWEHNERLVEQVLTPARDCSEFNANYTNLSVRTYADEMNARAGDLVTRMRDQLNVDRWSRVDRRLAARWEREDAELEAQRRAQQNAAPAVPTVEARDKPD